MRFVTRGERGEASPSLMLGLGSLSPDMMWGEGQDELLGGPYSDVLNRFATLESGGGQYRSNPMSSARGLLHFMPDTWKGVLRNYPDLGFSPEDIDDDAKQNRAAEVMMEREIVPALRRQLGREPTGAELYTAWALGTPDARKLFAADPNAPAASLFRPAVASSNPSIFYRDEEATIPRTAAEVAAEYARRWSGAKPMKESPMPQPEDDIDQRLANMTRMSQRVGQMQPAGAGISALEPRSSGGAGISALSIEPYLQLARQISPQPESRPWADALINAGAAMMQSNRPDFLGGVGAGVAAGNQSLAQSRAAQQQAQSQTARLALDLAKMGARDDKPLVLGKGGMAVDPRTGRTIAENREEGGPPKTRTIRRGDKVVTQEWNGAMWQDVAEGAAFRPDSEGSRQTDFQRKLDVARRLFPEDEQRQVEWASNPRSMDPAEARRRAATMVARDPTVTDKAGATRAWETFLSTGDDTALRRFYETPAPPSSSGSSWLPWNWFGGGEPSSPPSPGSQPSQMPAAPPPSPAADRLLPSASGLRGAPPAATGFGSWSDMRDRLQRIPADRRGEAVRRMRDAGVGDEQIRALIGG